ncbi:MAG: T9SS type A sorting domain-containing protein, partial [Candidatus Cloacimonetes bacterium]|nr:T9SS type A sorting domain-containing protein [Candidatus Cloacimonadota bacterium]
LLYAEADSLTEEEEYENAKTTYHDIIDFYPLTDYAVYSMLNLFSLETVSGQNFMALRNYYLTNPNCNINPERTKLSEYLANYCRIKMEQYPEAISFFEDIISNPETELDSVFAVIDAGYVYTLMGDNKAGYVGKMPELKPKSKVDFVEKRDNLITEIILGIEQENEQEEIPEYPVLKNNTPNPFKLNTNISFSIPNKSKVEIIVYNIKGQRVKSIVNDKYNKGWYNVTWDGTDNYGREVGSGVYFYRLKTENKEFVKKMLLIK